jgi:hypothetical protein
VDRDIAATVDGEIVIAFVPEFTAVIFVPGASPVPKVKVSSAGTAPEVGLLNVSVRPLMPLIVVPVAMPEP